MRDEKKQYQEDAEGEENNSSSSSFIPHPSSPPTEVGGPKGPEPTRYGDWENKGRCVDF